MANGWGGRRKGAGRPRGSKVKEMRQLAREQAHGDAERMLGFMLSVADNVNVEIKVRIAAANHVMNRAWGLPRQRQEITGLDTRPVTVVFEEVTNWRGGEDVTTQVPGAGDAPRLEGVLS